MKTEGRGCHPSMQRKIIVNPEFYIQQIPFENEDSHCHVKAKWHRHIGRSFVNFF